MKNNRHSIKVRAWFGQITMLHVHAKFEENLLKTSAVISKTIFEQRRMLYQDYGPFYQNKTFKIISP